MVFESKVLWKIFGPNRHVKTRVSRLHAQELHDLNFSPIIIRMFKERRASREGHVAHMGLLMGRPEGKRLLGKCRCSWSVGLKGLISKLYGRAWAGLFWLRIGRSNGLF